MSKPKSREELFAHRHFDREMIIGAVQRQQFGPPPIAVAVVNLPLDWLHYSEA
ncbi:hypothetical protein [Paraburkholderia atlantica]|uniref:hypothetical protein n=1 Tax=Paraburkholderia atlantica TaxID=2654982 RepID=UPI00161FD885|nr:hypothetical protein [Paraburkholderia atlantica]MBB5509256.1 hypothetical protein [Paraburkholderia atlantica]